MLKKNHISLLMILLTCYVSYGQSKNFLNLESEIFKDSINFFQIKTNSLFNSNQIISLLILQKESLDKYDIKFSHSNLDLKTTSSFAESENAAAAINAGFFNMDSGGSATYFEISDTVISKTRPSELKWGIADSIINGAIVIINDFQITIQPANSDQFYESSKKEDAVLVSGPLLLLNSEKVKLADVAFSNKRHPRTFLGITEKFLLFITVDGRSEDAEGMNLLEAQEFLLNLGCVDAINLDGGGSTTMWTKDNGIVNFPSDKSGERPVSNVLLIIKK